MHDAEAVVKALGIQWFAADHDAKLACGQLVIEAIQKLIPNYDLSRNLYSQFFFFANYQSTTDLEEGAKWFSETAAAAKDGNPSLFVAMSTKTREVIWGGRMMGADMRAQTARQEARKAARGRSAWKGYGGPAQPSPTIGQCLNGGYGWLEIECCRCKTRASLSLDAIRRARDTPIWKLEPSFRCRSCGTRRYKPPVRMIKLTEQREITPYKWVHP